ncbi:hypothetical protein EDC19_2028 [Natranaerovirga hydrolytica]|uniref:Uncharacterized protein n=1 Tax=Natranaerovirga hydrolytica TaxID=680378 RepID=A0A4R1MLX5_9FIRM|nr:hypothetical protein [Natranaerovirga hydrolytica]TCK92872.1 hypothetical protein EDC19_2028 [Natranaerovirga hydrolytica]
MDYNNNDLTLPNQNYMMGIIGGILGAVAGALIWAVITVVTDYQIGWMAIGVGFLVGKSVSYFGNGEHVNFRIIGAIFALLGCLFGNVLALTIILSNYYSVPLFELIGIMNIGMVIELLVDTFDAMDILFYGLAILQGYKISVKEVVNKDIDDKYGML